MPFRDPQSSDEQIFGISPAGDLFEVFRSSATFATAPYDLSAAIGTVPRLVGNPAPFVDPQSGAEQIFARAVNGDLIVVARGLHDGGLVWYDLSGPGTPPLASDPVPFRDPQSGQEQVFATSTGGSLFEVFRDSLTFAVYPYGLSLGASVRGAPAPFVDPQIGSEQIVVSGTNGDVFDFARALSGGGVGLFDLTRQTPGAPTLGGDPVPFRDPQSGQEQIFGVSTGGHLFEVYRDTATFVTSAFDLSGTTSPLSGRPSPFRDPQTGMEQIFVRVANSDLERFDRSPSFGLALTDLTVQSANGQTTAGNPHPFADPQVNTEQVIAASSVVQVSSCPVNSVATYGVDPNALSTTGGGTQLITEVGGYGVTTATYTAWDRGANGCWAPALLPGQAVMPYVSEVGYSGLSDFRREGDGSTPTGMYDFLSTVYGNSVVDPSPAYTYHLLVCGDWWDEASSDPQYNQFVHVPCGTTPTFAGSSEALWTETQPYQHFAVINFNPAPTNNPIGSGIFMHDDTTSGDTNGCIALPNAELDAVLGWMTPGANPHILIATRAEMAQLSTRVP